MRSEKREGGCVWRVILTRRREWGTDFADGSGGGACWEGLVGRTGRALSVRRKSCDSPGSPEPSAGWFGGAAAPARAVDVYNVRPVADATGYLPSSLLLGVLGGSGYGEQGRD